MTTFKVKYVMAPEKDPSRVFCRLYAAPYHDQTYVSLGTLTMRPQEFRDFKIALMAAQFEES